MNHYSYHCKQCGFTVNGTKEEARAAKKGHRVNAKEGRRCTGMVEFSPGRFCRTGLEKVALARRPV